MAVGDYAKTIYVNGGVPGISAEKLNNNENKTNELDKALVTTQSDIVKSQNPLLYTKYNLGGF